MSNTQPYNKYSIYWLTAFLSLMFSFSIALQQDVINPDAVCYLMSAQEVGASGIANAMRLCEQAAWPLYPVLIYAFSHLTSISVTGSAYLLDSLFTLISVLTFLALVEKLGGSRRVMWLAAFVILTAHQFNDVREYIIRDHGFWAFYLTSMLFMLRYMQQKTVWNAVGFGASLAVATLFRLEGAVFLALLPFLALLQKENLRTRCVDFLKLNIVGIASVFALCGYLLMHPQSVDNLGRLPELAHQLANGYSVMAEQYRLAIDGLTTHVLPMQAARDAVVVWPTVLVFMYFWNILVNFSVISALLLIYGFSRRVYQQFSSQARLVWMGYVALNLLIAAVFFAERLFFSKRYLIALVLVLLLYIPFVLDRLLSSSETRQRIAAYLAMAFLLCSSLSVMLSAGDSKVYLQTAGNWLKTNVAEDQMLYTNDLQLAYYTGHYGNSIFAVMRDQRNGRRAPWMDYDYLAIRVGQKQQNPYAEEMAKLHVGIVKAFANKKGDEVIIYKVPRTAEVEGVR